MINYSKILLYLIVTSLFLTIFLQLTNYFGNNIKLKLKGFKTAESNTILFNNEPLEEFIFKYILWEDTGMMPINNEYKQCINNSNLYDINCFMKLKNKNVPYAHEREFYDCEWTYGGSFVAANYKNYYLMDISEKPCGSMKIYFHDYYLIKYDGKIIEIIKKSNFGKPPNGPIKSYKIEEKGIRFTNESCWFPKQNCFGLDDEVFFYEFI